MVIELEIVGVGRKKEPPIMIENADTYGGSVLENTDELYNQDQIGSKTYDFDDQTEELLQQSLVEGSPSIYNEAIILSKYRDALLEQAVILRNQALNDLRQKSKKITPKIYGWKSANQFACSYRDWDSRIYDGSINHEEVWDLLRKVEAYQYELEQPSICKEFFHDLKQMMVKEDLKTLPKELAETFFPEFVRRSNSQDQISRSNQVYF
jgi:hypothetical protein